MKIIDTSAEILSAFDGDRFSMDRWKAYIDRFVPGAKDLCREDMQECMGAGFTWEGDFLPVLEAVARDAEKREAAVRSFRKVTEGLDRKIRERFGKTVDCDLILYLGLCNGAGWVTELAGRRVALLGIEKILELDWHGPDAMTGLVIHELGHVYHMQHGDFGGETGTGPDHFLWQLFTEGVAMVFEQEIVGDPEYFHQDTDGWKAWCDGHAARILEGFRGDLGTMTNENQRYFGDWTRFEGHGDTGYYLGARFVRSLLETDSFDRIILYGPDQVREAFGRFGLPG